MADRFPKLRDDAFPHLENVDPFSRRVPFDYSRYDYTATAKLCVVPWPSDYQHVADWGSASERDAWFSDVEGRTVELSNGFTRPQLDTISLPVPYDVALTYNYLYMRVPVMTEEEPIDYETSAGLRTVCAFVSDVIYQAPSSTAFVLEVDVWTTYLPHLAVRSLVLERGHAPMYALDVDTYLADPIAHTDGLLTPDVDYGRTDAVRTTDMIPLVTSSPCYVMASTVPYADVSSLGQAVTVAGSPATFYDLTGRDGYQRGVSGYVWDFGGKDYTAATQPSRATNVTGDTPTGLYYYAIDGSTTTAALQALFDAYPQLLQACQAFYVVPSNLVTLGTSHVLSGVTLREVRPNDSWQQAGIRALAKADFNYPTKYAGITKLYTFPYAHIEVSDGLGQNMTLRVEDTHGSVKVFQRLSALWPALDWTAAIEAQSTAQATSYVWRHLDGTTSIANVPGAELSEWTFDIGIPTYALYMAAERQAALTGAASANARRASALQEYDATARNANTAYANATASNATAYDNAEDSADVQVLNTANSGDTADANTVLQNTMRTNIQVEQNATNAALATISHQQIYDVSNADIEYNDYATDTKLKGEAVSGVANMAANAIAGNAFGFTSAGVATIVNMTTSSAIAQLANGANLAKQGANVDANDDASAEQRSLNEAVRIATNTAATSINTNNVTLANTNAENSADVAKANALRSKNTSDGNALATREEAIAIAKNRLELLRTTNAKEAYETARHEPPAALGNYSDEQSMLREPYHERALHVHVMTQDANAIARAGDAFLRYGYRYEGIWEPDGAWCPTGHDMCHWQASDVRADLSQVPNVRALEVLKSMLRTGVTVWADPYEIGA